MEKIKYESLNSPRLRYVDKITEFIFRNPSIYFLFLISVTFIILVFGPHTITLNYQENNAEGYDEVNGFLDFGDNYIPNYTPQAEIVGQESNKALHGIDDAQCSGIKDNDRFDCFPQDSVSEEKCKARGCCWVPVNSSSKGELGVPYCYYPSNFKSYKYINVSATSAGATAYLQNLVNSSYPNNIQIVKIDFNYLTDNIMQIKIYDPVNARFESSFPNMSMIAKTAAKNASYTINIDKDKIGFNVVRKSNNQSIFNTENVGGFIFSDQLLQLSARLPSHRLYGLGQQRNNFLLSMNWQRITLFNHDQEPQDKSNLYGSHPFYLALEDNGLSSGVLLHNTNAMDVILQPSPAITYRTIGGVLNLYLFTGPSPADVLRQYTQLVGRPFLPPYWSLGFHLCKFGYNSLNETIKVWNRTRAAGIPFDTQWNDIDYMDRRNDFTYDKVAFKGLPEFVDQLHKVGMHYVVILDPGISAGETPGTYPPYDDGLKDGLFVKDPVKEQPFYTKVWNYKSTVFPDFFNPKTPAYWQKQINTLHDTIAFDGLWIDMNEPSTEWNGGKYGCAPNPLEEPPYLPAVIGGKLYYRTVCMSARHHDQLHYNVHNLFASMEAVHTTQALREIRKKRPFVISRASYPGHGHFTGVWTGDIRSTWDDMSHSISDVLSFSLFGIPMSGADICGFNGNTTVALCQRWSQLGAFYPFSRNHNSIDNFDQDPVALGPAVVNATRNALLTRYSLLPYLYTLFWHAHTHGDTVARPMFVEFPQDDKTYGIHTQFLWGSALLIAPLLSQEQSYATAYLPAGRWYEFYSYKPIDSKSSTFLLPSQPDAIPLLLRGGRILPTQQPNTTTTTSRLNPLGLLVCLCEHGKAFGDLYWDDGDSLDFELGMYNVLNFSAANSQVSSSVERWSYPTVLRLGEVRVLGVTQTVTKVLVNGSPAHFTYKADVKFLNVTDLAVDLSKPFTLSWS